MNRLPTRLATLPLCALLGVALLLPAAAGQSLYGMSEESSCYWNGTILDNLAGHFEIDGGDSFYFVVWNSGGFDPLTTGGLTIFYSTSGGSGIYERYVDFAVSGEDRYTLRFDGRLFRNGLKILELFSLIGSPGWIALDVDGEQVVSLRRDGVLTTLVDTGGFDPAGFVDTVALERGASFFTDVAVDGGVAVALRADGMVFLGGDTDTPVLRFIGGPGVNGPPLGEEGEELDPDGASIDTSWMELAFDAETGLAYGLRRDGVVSTGFIDTPPLPGGQPAPGTEIARLPPPNFVSTSTAVTLLRVAYPATQEYGAIELTDDGQWVALRGNGEVYDEDTWFSEIPLVDYAGGGSFEQVFTDLELNGGRTLAIRRDGKVFLDLDPTAVADFPGDGFIGAGLSFDPPNLDAITNSKPKVATYKMTLLEGQPVTIPTLASDTDLAAEDLEIEPVLPLPEGVTWDEPTRTFSVDDSQTKGGRALKFTVFDGFGKKPKTFKHKVKVVPPDSAVKNRKPSISSVKNARLLVGFTTDLPLFVSDRDGDEVTVNPNFTKGLFAEVPEASFDQDTNTLTWTPALNDVGKHDAFFFVTDGIATKKYRLKLQVKAPLYLP